MSCVARSASDIYFPAVCLVCVCIPIASPQRNTKRIADRSITPVAGTRTSKIDSPALSALLFFSFSSSLFIATTLIELTPLTIALGSCECCMLVIGSCIPGSYGLLSLVPTTTSYITRSRPIRSPRQNVHKTFDNNTIRQTTSFFCPSIDDFQFLNFHTTKKTAR